MGRTDEAVDEAPRPVVRHVPKAAVIAASVLLGAFLVWALVRPLAPQVFLGVLFERYAMFCVSYGVLFCVCEWMAFPRSIRLSPLVGPVAAAVTASMYLQVFGIPSETVLLAIIFFLFGFHGLTALRAPEEGRRQAVFKMLYSMSLASVLFAGSVILAVFLNCLIAGGAAAAGPF